MNDDSGLPTRTLTSEHLSLAVLDQAGPRIVRLSFRDKPNLFAVLPDFAIPTAWGDYHFWGGHRLWHSPEAMPRTYYPDDEPPIITALEDGLRLEGATEPPTGVRKTIELHLSTDKAQVRLTHTLANEGMWAVELAPWSITQMRLGGIVIAPMPAGNSDPAGLLPNRQVSLWPYTRINDPRLRWDDDFLLLQASAQLPPFKVGYFNQHGWLGYWIDGIFFRKRFIVSSGSLYPDGNCNAEIYCNDRFVELESLGPLTRLEPGGQVQAEEIWELSDGLDESDLDNVIERISNLSER